MATHVSQHNPVIRAQSRAQPPGRVSIYRVLKPCLPQVGFATGLALGAGAADIAAIWGVAWTIDNPQPISVAAALIAWLAGAALLAASVWVAHAAEGRFAARLRRRVADHLLRLPADAVARQRPDSLRRLIDDDVSALHHMIAHLPSEVVTLLVIPGMAVCSLVALAGPRTLLALIPGALAAIAYLLVIPRISARYGEQRNEIMGDITTAVNDYARGIRVFRSFGGQHSALDNYRTAARRFTVQMLSWVHHVATPAACAVALLQALASYALAYSVVANESPATVAGALLFSLALVTPALRLGHGLDYVAQGRAAAGRIDSFLAQPILSYGQADAPQGGAVKTTSLRVVTAEGAEIDLPALNAPAATLSALTGPSGAGKSTLLRIIAGQQEPVEGSVHIGEDAVSNLSSTARHEVSLLIPQGLSVLPGTVRDNLRLIRIDSDASYTAALKRAQLEVDLDQDATVLSGGQCQRLAVARAFLSTAPVVLIDEPTSALDDDTALRLFNELIALAHEEGRTVIVVTHDPVLASRADANHIINRDDLEK